jgi:hypothetical protein
MTAGDSDEGARGVEIAPADTLKGQLQRGRGAGFLAALEVPPSELWPILVECITHDPRWDPQVESRGEYYAHLVLASNMSLDPLETHLRANEGSEDDNLVRLTTDTLTEIGRRGHPRAIPLLRSVVKQAHHWSLAFDALLEIGTAESIAGLDELLLARAPDDEELARHLYRDGDEAPWNEWRTKHPRIAAGIEAKAREHKVKCAPAATLEGLSLEELIHSPVADWGAGCDRPFVRKQIDLIVQPSDLPLLASYLDASKPKTCYRALGGLSGISSPAACEILRAFLEANPDISPKLNSVLGKALVAQPAECVLLCGRDWFERADWPYRNQGESILSGHATLEDVPRLTRALAESLEDPDDAYRAGNILEAFSRLPGIGPIPDIDRAFVGTCYAYTRRDAARALHVTDPQSFAQERAFECLWDSHNATRVIGIEAVDLSQPGTLECIALLAADRFEDEDVRKAAQLRLGTSPSA